jgi:hypothetical protein
MLTQLFQDSDYVLFMVSDLNKVPHSPYLIKASKATPLLGTYYAINPIDAVTNRNTAGARSPRASINVTAFRNFLFEIDSLPLEEQKSLLEFLNTKVPITQVTFSGSSSYHAIISVVDTLPFTPHTEQGVAQYSQAWRALDAELSAIAREYLGDKMPEVLFDPACKDPARLSRTPGAIRPDTLKIQTELNGFGKYINSDFILSLMSKHSGNEYYTTSDAAPTSPDERGALSKRTLDFLNGWKPELASVWPWHTDFIFAVKDLQTQNYSFEEAQRILTAVTGYLDTNDIYQMRDVWSRNNFKLTFRPTKRKSS